MKKNKCKNCESILYGKFCSNCGQKVYNESDKSLNNISEEVFHFITHFDGKFFKTLKSIYRYPGKLSMDYSNGIRKKYYKPVSFYLLIVLLYLLFPLADGMNMEMKYYKETPIIGGNISQQIESKSKLENLSEEFISEKFKEKSKSTSKILLLLLIPLSAPILYLLYFKRKRFVFDNFILLTEISIFFLFSIFILVPLISLPFLYFSHISLDNSILMPISIIIFWLYCSILLHNVFAEKWWVSVLKGGVFALSFLSITLDLYRIIVFETTFALI